MAETTVQYNVRCKRCNSIDPKTGLVDPKRMVGYSGMMYERMKEYGHSRPEYCEECRAALTMEKMTMGAAYYSLKMLPGTDKNVVIPGELGKVWHPDRPHVKEEKPKTFDASKFGATPGKVVEIYEWLKDPKHQVVIIKGGTGSGKSTALPYWLVYPPEGVPSDFFIRDGQIVITQPRILATTGVSKYLGTLMGSSVGKGFDIGYRYSKDRNADRFNAAFMATDGSLINMIKQGQLSEISVVMIDEAHERSLNIDIILNLMRNLLPLYPHLKLLIVSATLNAEKFLEYFGTETAKLIEFEPKSKFTYVVHNAEESEKIHYENPNKLKKELVEALVKKTLWLLSEQAEGRKEYGHILSFLQGVKPIEEAVSLLRAAVTVNPKLRNMVEVLPLYSALDEKDSDYAINITEPSKIRVIIATNVAEASITVEGVVYVIESGVENQAQWEVEDSKKTVELRRISKANAKQRFGRSGRTRNGEVFTLYTESQFEEMIDFPIPAIERSDMEEQFLKLKELGIDEFGNGWIDSPKAEEQTRAVASLKNSGAIDDEDLLTEYGVLLTQFHYPASLADLLILADRFGCAVEVATLLPVIKYGGSRSFFVKDTNWDEPTKQKVETIQSVLSTSCRDDVEFIFRMYSFWKNPPLLSAPEEGRTKELRERREEFEETFYVDFKVIEEGVDPERGRIMRLLNAHRKDRNVREVQFSLLERTRTVVAYCIPYTLATEGSYEFNPKQENDGGAASCVLAIAKERADKINDLKSQKVSFLKLSLELIPWEKKEIIQGSISDEDRILKAPKVPEFETKLFDNFVVKHKIGEELVVDVVGYAEHAGDFRVSLIVKDQESGYETWLTPNDINFTSSSAVVKQIPIGTKIHVLVKEIVPVKSFVRLFCLPLIEVELEKTYGAFRKIDGQIVTKAKVIEVRTDNRIVFVAEASRPAEGFFLVIHASEKVLYKSALNYKVGETCMVKFRLDSDFDYKAKLPAVSEKVSDYIKQTGSRLGWVDGQLIFKQKMKYADLLELSKIDSEETSFLAALDYLYLFSNTNWASKVIDSGWIEKAKSQYVIGATVSVKVKKVLGVGLSVELPDGQVGFIQINNTNDFAKEGESLKAKVINFDEQRQNVNLSLVISENSAIKKFAVGQEKDGIVDGLANYGAFVKLGMGYSGLIHISKMGQRVKHPSELLSKGDKVLVEVIGIEDTGGKTKISLRLVSVVPRGT